jgi:hypothetical protein
LFFVGVMGVCGVRHVCFAREGLYIACFHAPCSGVDGRQHFQVVVVALLSCVFVNERGPFVPLMKDMTFDICLPIVAPIFSPSFRWVFFLTFFFFFLA